MKYWPLGKNPNTHCSRCGLEQNANTLMQRCLGFPTRAQDYSSHRWVVYQGQPRRRRLAAEQKLLRRSGCS
jgi:hypothetical protein